MPPASEQGIPTLASLLEGGGTAQAVTEGVLHIMTSSSGEVRAIRRLRRWRDGGSKLPEGAEGVPRTGPPKKPSKKIKEK